MAENVDERVVVGRDGGGGVNGGECVAGWWWWWRRRRSAGGAGGGAIMRAFAATATPAAVMTPAAMMEAAEKEAKEVAVKASWLESSLPNACHEGGAYGLVATLSRSTPLLPPSGHIIGISGKHR